MDHQRPILVVDDDEEDRLLIEEAFEEFFGEVGPKIPLVFLEDGEALMDYLLYKNNHTIENSPRPTLILLDLNMPKKSGKECLTDIKTNSELKAIPIVVLSTSSAVIDIDKSYILGANSFITKPTDFSELVSILSNLRNYWFDTITLPHGTDQ